jgi:hypothetical protein
MTALFRSIPIAACLVALSAAGALAQNNNPGHSAGPAGSATTTPTYPPGQAGDPALSPGHLPRGAGGVAAGQNPNVPGATGQTVVPGNNSTIGAARHGTVEQKTGQTQSQGGGGGGGR